MIGISTKSTNLDFPVPVFNRFLDKCNLSPTLGSGTGLTCVSSYNYSIVSRHNWYHDRYPNSSGNSSL
ncbi:hypothetical protein HanIR_Chr12g0604221 [Helianthus annuus]|nr:hypothetical protein HanIR_Chr12g0604221 [Helianthus annuus]